ncbi:MAG: hypothetical protein A3F78_08615 [Burkholderiales bacterium RIFCSPLOWO2_12_FULL_61_40]|nr:MAG: hypothetical protein A3F78_08615 [Burkholderiales bacterium RIFCSPLOWO2_12_FULL_61_40]
MLLLTLLGAAAPAHADTKTRTSSFEYNAQGLLVKETIEPTNPNDCLQTSYGHDLFGNKTSATSTACAGASAPATHSASTPRTASSSFGPDGRFPVSSTNALNQSETKIFDTRFGTLKSLTGPNELSTHWEYDGFGRKTLELRADGTRTTWAYKLCTEAGANCPAMVGPSTVIWVVIEQSLAVNLGANAPEQRQYYDTLNRVVRTQTQGFDGTDAAPTLVQDTEYNALGQVERQSKPYALSGGTPVWSNYTYDKLGRTLSESHPDTQATGDTATTTFSYSALSTTVTNANNQTKTTVKNAQGQVASVTDAMGSTVVYRYDAHANLVSTNAAGSVTTLHYNQRGQKDAMQDPAMGSWTYSYNAYGELVSQRDSLNQSTTMEYDMLGRMTKRLEPDLTSEWSYDKKFDGSACGTGSGPGKDGIGKLCEAKANNGYKRSHTYDPLGRLTSTATALDNANDPAVVSETFDPNTGRVSSKTWPTGYQARYDYSALGYLKTVTGGGTNDFAQTVSHTVLAMNAQGQITQYKTGNKVTTVNTYALDTNRLTSRSATLDGQASGNVLSQDYLHDALGNLTKRTDHAPGVNTEEGFSYDSLNRLSTATLLGGAVSPPSTTQVMYDARGNITYKSDVGRYWYDAQRPNRMTNVTLETAPGATHALTGTRTLSYAFDDARAEAQSVNTLKVGNGNLWYTVSQDTDHNKHNVRWESYTSFNMPNEIKFGTLLDIHAPTNTVADRTLSFVYGPEHQRIKQNVTLTSNGTSAYHAGNTWYLNGEDSLGLSYEKEVRADGITEHKHYLTAAGVTFALVTSRTGTQTATTTSYLHHDQLGSISAITDEAGAVTERLAYDPWGKRRFINSEPGKTDALDVLVGQNTDRGYTEHEHLDEMGIIHMNGRIYDPLMGRFMSSDPTIPNPYELQSFNRYSYVLNNPLFYTDPTGYEYWGHNPNTGEGSSSQFRDTGNGTVSNTYTGDIGAHSDHVGAGYSRGDAVSAQHVAGLPGQGTQSVHDYSRANGTWQLTDFGRQQLTANNRAWEAAVAKGDLVGMHNAFRFYTGIAFDEPTYAMHVAAWGSVLTRAMSDAGYGIDHGVTKTMAAASFGLGMLGIAAKGAANWKSVKQFGHTFGEHGAGAKNTERLLDRAHGTGNPQGQWLNNEKAAEALSVVKVDGPATVRIPQGLGQVIKPDGTIVKTEWATVVPRGDGLRTAYPIVGP